MGQDSHHADVERVEGEYAAIVASSDDAIVGMDLAGIITSWNAGAERLYGYPATEAVGRPASMLVPGGQEDETPGVIERLQRGERVGPSETARQARDGRRLVVSLNISPIRDATGAMVGASVIARDITEQKQSEQASAAELADYRRLQAISGRMITRQDVQALYTELIEAAIEVTRADGGTMQSVDEATDELCLLQTKGIPQPARDRFARVPRNARTSCATASRMRQRVVVDYVSDEWVAGTDAAREHLDFGIRAAQSTPLVSRSGRLVGVLTTHWNQPRVLSSRQLHVLDILARQASDLIERAQTEDALRQSEQRYRTLFDSIDEGFCIIQVLFEGGRKPIDYRFLETNPAFERQTGMIDAVGRTAREVVPDLEEHWFNVYGRVATTGEPVRFTHGSEAMGRWFDVYAFRVDEPADRRVALLFKDVTQQKQAERERERLLAEVEAEQARLAEVFHYAPSFMCILRGPDFVFERANDLYLRLVGRTELVGKPLLEALPEVEDQGFIDVLNRVYQTGEPYVGKDVPVSLHRRPGAGADSAEARWLDFVYQPLRDADGKVTGVFAQGVDLTERKQAEDALRESEQQLRFTLEATEFGSWELDLSGPEPSALRRSLKHDQIFGYSDPPPKWNYQIFISHVLEEDRSHVSQRLEEALNETGEWEFECRIRRADNGEVRWVWARGQEVEEPDKPRRMLGLVQDVTARKRIEQKLRESEAQHRSLNQTLEQRVAERTAEAEHRARQLQVMAKELTDAEHRERRRLAQLLHDDLQQILVGAKLRLPAAADDARELIGQAIETARSLSSELAPPVLYDVGLGAAMDWLARWVGDKYNLEVTVVADGSEPVEDEQLRVMLFEAVRELLLNVVKHAGVTEARVQLYREGREVHVQVEDLGAGFDLEARRADASQRGYGLFSLQERLELVGGKVDIDSVPGVGTRVHITLPLSGAADESAEVEGVAKDGRPGGVPVAGRSCRILLTDDHDIVRRGLANLLAIEPDMELVAEAGSGEEAVELARHHRPDVVVMDISLPGINGIEATRRIVKELPHVTVIGLSMHEERDVAEAMRSAGARAYFSKGRAADHLVQAVRQFGPMTAAPH